MPDCIGNNQTTYRIVLPKMHELCWYLNRSYVRRYNLGNQSYEPISYNGKMFKTNNSNTYTEYIAMQPYKHTNTLYRRTQRFGYKCPDLRVYTRTLYISGHKDLAISVQICDVYTRTLYISGHNDFAISVQICDVYTRTLYICGHKDLARSVQICDGTQLVPIQTCTSLKSEFWQQDNLL